MQRRVTGRKAPRSATVEARWRDQRERLLQAAQRAIHRSGPQISMDEIAAEAGLTKPIFYRHFGDRRGLARALRDSAFGLVLGSPTGNAADDRQAARQRIAAFYPVVSDPDHLRRVVVGFATGFQMFVEMNRNLYRFLRTEGVLDSMWDEPDSGRSEPVAESIAASLRAVFADRDIDDVTAQIWANALRGMVREIVDWSSDARVCDRFELERQFDLLARAMIDGLGQALAGPKRARPVRAPRTRRPSGAQRSK